jgi:hypothetical protein
MKTTAMPKKKKRLSLVGGTTTPHVSDTCLEMGALFSGLCEQVEMLQGLCRTMGIFAYADDSLDGLSVKDIGNTALLMGRTLDRVHSGLVKVENMAESAIRATAAA